MYEEDRRIDQDHVLEGHGDFSTRAGCSKRRSAASPVVTTEEDKLYESVIDKILAGILDAE